MANELKLVYDKECPVCNSYCTNLQIQKSFGDLQLINARENSALVHELADSNIDINDGFVLIAGDKTYHGDDAINRLAMLSSRSNIFNRINYWIFKSKTLSLLLYPVLRLFRNILLKLLGKQKILIAGK